MKLLNCLLLASMPVFFLGTPIGTTTKSRQTDVEDKRNALVYEVSKLQETLTIDANWNKAEWRKIKALKIENYMGKISPFKPKVEAKMMYDSDHVYVIFRVKDRFVRSVVQEYNGNVSGDSCVEFFFSPDTESPLKYFNLEVNAGGTPLIFYVTKPWTEFKKLNANEIEKIEIAHSLPEKVDPEITEPVIWTIEYKIPLSVLRNYSNVTNPGKGVIWKANFYKTGSKTSNPNYITWSFVNHPKPNFHLPEFFGTLKFQ